MQEMIRDREIAIQLLEKKATGQDERAECLKKEQEEIANQKQTIRQRQREELMALWKEYDGFLCRYQDAKDSLDAKKQQQNNGGQTAALGPGEALYHEIMKDVVTKVEQGEGNVGGTDYSSNYVVRMQSQLCRAMHGMGVMESQRQMTKEQMEQIQKKAKDVMPEMIEEKSHVELKMVNELIMADTSKREVETKKNDQHNSFFKQKNDLMEKIERQIDEAENANDNESSDNPENDEEEEEAKEELREMLEEGKVEIERLKNVIKETEEKVEELKIRAAMAQGQDVVDDIVTSIAEEFAERDGSDDEGSDDGSY